MRGARRERSGDERHTQARPWAEALNARRGLNAETERAGHQGESSPRLRHILISQKIKLYNMLQVIGTRTGHRHSRVRRRRCSHKRDTRQRTGRDGISIDDRLVQPGHGGQYELHHELAATLWASSSAARSRRRHLYHHGHRNWNRRREGGHREYVIPGDAAEAHQRHEKVLRSEGKQGALHG